MTDFQAINAEAKQAQAKLDRLIRARAIELYPHIENMWSEGDIGFEGGAITQEDALEEARKSLEANKTAVEWQQEREANRRVVRHFYLTPEEDDALRVEAFRSGRSRNDIIVDLLRAGLEAKKPDA